MSARLTVLVAAAEFPGHVFPEIALASALASRGHRVTVQTSERWREEVESTGATLLPVEEVGGVLEHGSFDDALARSVRLLAERIEAIAADVVVSDIAVAAPPLAAELAGAPEATLVPTVFPVQAPGAPPYPLGLRHPRSAFGRALWRAVEPPAARLRRPARWLREVPDRLDRVRAQLGLAPLERGPGRFSSYGAISTGLCLVATLPQLEYRRDWPPHVHVTGPMNYERPFGEIELPPGNEPLVLVSSSTAQDPERDLLRASIDALAREPLRVLATINEPGARWAEALPANATVVDWVSFSQVMPPASLVICGGGHGTVARALAEGTPVLVSPKYGDQPENGARAAWAGAGLTVPRGLLGPSAIRWAARRILADERFAARAAAIAEWAAANDGAVRGAELIEAYARR